MHGCPRGARIGARGGPRGREEVMADSYVATILLVDDEPDLTFVLSAHLRASGYNVLIGRSGREAIEMAEAHQPDLIVMDVGMPEMDGVTATRRLKSDPKTEHIPIIMLTARSRTEDLVLGLEAGAQEYVSKPFDVAELLARVRTVHRLATARRRVEELNERLEDEIGQKTRRLQTLYDYTRKLSQCQKRDEILDSIVQCVKDATGSGRISLMLTDESGEYLTCARAVGIDPDIVDKIRIKNIEGVAGQVFRSGKTFVATAYGEKSSLERGYGREAFLSTPLVSTSLQTPDEILGVLNVTEKSDDEPFTREEIECIRSITDAGAIALNNLTRRTRLEQSVRVLLTTVGRLSEYRDNETGLHLERVSQYARILTRQMSKRGPYAGRVNDEFVQSMGLAAPMHDIGKVGIADDILTKSGPLTDEEYAIMKTHTTIGYRVLSAAMEGTGPVPLLQHCIDIAYCHHERFDGRGYPRGLAGDQIPLSARIIALVDAYDAITSRRCYKDALPHEEAVHRIERDAGKHFDPDIVAAFLECEPQFRQVAHRFADSDAETRPVAIARA